MQYEAPISYTPSNVLTDPDGLFDAIRDDLAWIRHPGSPRAEYYSARDGLPYAYKAYGGMRQYDSQPLDFAIAHCWERAEAFTRTKYDAVFLNMYEDGKDHLGWHADDSPEMDDERAIAIISLGAEREIWFRRADPERRLISCDRLRLAHGSLCVMPPGMQDTHQHRTPKSDRMNCGPRISLTFRGVVR